MPRMVKPEIDAKAACSPDPLERPEGGFAMVALDQRESMRDLLHGPRTDDAMRRFKRLAAEALAPVASAVLLDRLYGVDPRRPPAWAATTPLILAADRFEQAPGLPVADSALDPEVTVEVIHTSGAVAVKLLVLWRRDESASARAELVGSFVALAHAAGVPAVVEGIARPAGDAWTGMAERDEAIVDAAAELAAYGADLYKAEVPGTPARPATIEATARRVTYALPCPWVVLSNGVAPDAFPDAVDAACQGGASGFLAGRAIWTDAARAADPATVLATSSVRRFHAIAARVPARRA